MKNHLQKFFNGRIGRKQFVKGYFYLLSAYLILSVIYALLDTYVSVYLGFDFILYFVIVSISMVLAFSLSVRRLHDTGSSAWWALMLLIPLINLVFFIHLAFDKGDSRENKYGAVPQRSDFLLPFYSEKMFWPLIIIAGATYIAILIMTI